MLLDSKRTGLRFKKINYIILLYAGIVLLCIIGIFNYNNSPAGEIAYTNGYKENVHFCQYKLWENILEISSMVPIGSILIDVPVLESLHNQSKCESLNRDYSIMIGINKNKTIGSLNRELIDIVYYEDDPNKDYIKYNMTKPGIGADKPSNTSGYHYRIIPKIVNYNTVLNLLIPSNIKLFKNYWKRSQFIDCLNINMKRSNNLKPRLQPIQSSESLAALRNTLLQYNMFSFILDGTLLGWYRECTVIPHTHDLDVSVFVEEYNQRFVDDLLNNSTDFKVLRKLGSINDSMELTVEYKRGYPALTDIFFMYTEVNSKNNTVINWSGGISENGQKYKYTYSKYEPYCAGDLHNHLVWVTCSPDKVLTRQYGPNWRVDHPSNKYKWNKSGTNIELNGKFTKEQMKELYKIY